jgi:exonuclease SbcC
VLKKLTIKDFEAHKDSFFEFGPGLNVIYGKSNHGKSATLRAIELAAYNNWAAGENKKEGIFGPVRIGQPNCEIYVESDKGSVKVKRGKGINEWEIDDGTELVELKNPGSGEIPQAQEVLGLNTFEVAENRIRFNWSDQRDKHFLIDEVEGKSSSPSFVAAVLDEVGGLSGCEDLIRALASDKSKFEQEMKKTIEESAELDKEIHKYDGITEEQSQLEHAKRIIKEIENKKEKIEKIKSLSGKLKSLFSQIQEYKGLKTQVKNIAKAEKSLLSAIKKYKTLISIQKNNSRLVSIQAKLEDEPKKIDIKKAIKRYNIAEQNVEKVYKIKDIYGKIKSIQNKLKKIKLKKDKLG